jgi:hypothetical protein
MGETYQEGDIVIIKAGEDWPEHLFRVHAIYPDCLSGYSITGPLAGEYGEPAFDLILGRHEV